MTTAPYPVQPAARREWIEARRGPRNQVDPWRPHAFLVEQECSESRAIVSVATIFLTNRECPWRCLMCDLWKNTLTETVPRGAISAQIDFALQQCNLPGTDLLAERWQVKLYNSGSFFDANAIPPAEYPDIAQRISAFQRVIVECHPKLAGDGVLRFRDLIGTQLEVAMGLETANPDVLARLNKGMTLDDFESAAKFLTDHGIGVRAFILLRPPFTTEEDGILWARKSTDFAFDCGATAVSIIPTRNGNGGLEILNARGAFSPPLLSSLEETLDYGINLDRGRVFADPWDLHQFSQCARCFPEREKRLRAINLSQQPRARVRCPECEG